ncbi:MAG: CPBP family intramembrane metalloprotease, partial [Planctomycetes bacterium]|nr:CPBP family intramembrane metalloprotease [Planctomycetota bacterium]
FVALLPVTIIISACSLAIAGIAKSYKEAQTYISPLLLVFMVPSFMCLIPTIRPNMLLDLIPLIGPLVSLKSCMQGGDLAFMHLAISSAASIGFALLIVNASIKLLNNEQFLFSGLKNAGWGRFRKWGDSPDTPDGIEVIVLFAACVGLFMFAGGFFAQINIVAMVSGPLIAAIALPTLIAVWFGKFDPIKTLYLRKISIPLSSLNPVMMPVRVLWFLRDRNLKVWNSDLRILFCTVCLIPVLITVSGSLGYLQQPFAPENMAEEEQMRNIFTMLQNMGGLPLLLFCVALVPGICEELLCRGALLSGFNKSLGPRYAIWMSAFLFAALHMSPWRFAPQFILGVFLAIITLRTRSIIPAMMIHVGHNGLIAFAAWFAEQNPEQAGALIDPDAELPDPMNIIITLLIAASIACGLIKLMTTGAGESAEKIGTGEPAKRE